MQVFWRLFNWVLAILAIAWVASTWSNGHHGRAVLYAGIAAAYFVLVALDEAFRERRRAVAARAARNARISEQVEAAEIVAARHEAQTTPPPVAPTPLGLASPAHELPDQDPGSTRRPLVIVLLHMTGIPILFAVLAIVDTIAR